MLLIACTDAVTHESGDAPVTPTPWEYEAPDREIPPALDAAGVSIALGEAVAMIRWIDPRIPYDAYVEARTRFDDSCPARSDHNRQDLDLGDCVDGDGTSFYGYEVSIDMHNAQVDYDGISAWHHDFRFMSGNSQMGDTDGFAMGDAGTSLFRDYDGADGLRESHSEVWGDISRVGDPHGDWLDDALGVQLYVDSTRSHTVKTITIDGGVTRALGVARAFTYNGLVLDSDVCSLEPSGAMGVWGDDSRWIDVFFDEICDGCGEAYRGDEALGSVCADFTPWLDWANTPWD